MNNLPLDDDIAEYVFLEQIFSAPFVFFREYLETVSNLLDKEKQSHLNHIKELIGQGIVDDEFGTPPEHEWDYYRLGTLDELTRILYGSVFISVYVHFEAELAKLCHTSDPRDLKLDELAGRGIQRAKLYLEKVRKFPFPADAPEWEDEIVNYNRLRNCIVHNQGRLDEHCSDRKKLTEYAKRKHLVVTDDNEIALTEEFCREAIEVMERFLRPLVLPPTPPALRP